MKEKQQILIVEDEVINRRILKKILSPEYEILEAENGAMAWEILTNRKYEVAGVLLDIVMPIMNGYEFLAKIRQASMTELPIVVMTGEADNETEQKALDAGAWDFVTKPYQKNIIKSRLRNAIARRQVSVYEKMQKMAAHDSLTGLHNRGRMFSSTRKMLKEHMDTRFMFLRVDIDRFALYNTSFGEEEGDHLLCFLANLFQELAKNYELITYGRISADIFCACVPYEEGKSEKKLEEIVDYVQKKFTEYREDYVLDISVGVNIIKDNTLEVEEYYMRASMGAQKCKSQFENHIGYYDEIAGKRAADEVEIINEMQGALDQEQFVVYLQPKIDLASDTACGAEALVRWNHPIKGLVPPGLFIPVFERNGFVASVDYYVWEQTCKMLRKWLDAGRIPNPISVNISRVSMYNPQLVDMLVHLVEKYEIDYALLQLEITESAYMSNPDLMMQTIHDLRMVGFTILMDDFGSGYSSLNTLKDIEVDVLKIDMRFLPVSENVKKAEIILASMIKMANWLGMSVVVEGVETRKQRDFLEGAGCDYVQGYFYAKPMPQEEYEAGYVFVENQSSKEAQEPEGEIVPSHNVTILVIDDSEEGREILTEYFKEYYHVHTCKSAEEALIYLKHNKSKVRLILVDNIMPGMNGLDFLTYCQDDDSLSSIPQIMITANDNKEDQVNAFHRGAYDYITKPLVREVVEARIDHVMNVSRQYRVFENWKNDYRDMAERDLATGLLNKTAYIEMARQMLHSDLGDVKALLVLDVDDFKSINDQYGHLVGDQIIVSIAEELRRLFRKSDLIGRFGGDEFIVMMTHLPGHAVTKRKAEELIKNIGIKCAREHKVNAGVSIGIAFTQPGEDDFDLLFQQADEALYESKDTGKGRACVYGEKVPEIRDDNKPIILICGEDAQLYPTVALAYGNEAAFLNITSFQGLKDAFLSYRERICVICIDMQKEVVSDADAFYQYLLKQGGGEEIPIIAVCKEGDMVQVRKAMQLKIQDIITLPPHIGTIQRRLSRAMIESKKMS